MATRITGDVGCRNGDNAQALEMVVSELILPVPQGLENGMQKLLPLKPGYEWFSKDNFEKAVQCFDTLVQAQNEARTNVTNFFAGAIVDLYHKDRADRACSLAKTSPVREVPMHITNYEYVAPGGGSRDVTYRLHLEQLTEWSAQIPLDTLPLAALIVRQATPDDFYLATYERQRRTRDPLIYAKYGNWYVKVAEWE